MRAVLAVLCIGLFLMVAVMGFNSALADNQQRHDIENESFTPDPGNVTELENSNLDAADYDDTVTVRNESNTTMTEGTDYEWHESNGTLTTLEGGDLANDSTGYVTYGYNRPPPDQVMLANVFSQIPSAMGAFLPLAALLFLLLIVRGG